MRIEPGQRWRLKKTGALVEIESAGRSGRVAAFYIEEDGSKRQPEWKNVVSFSLDFLETHATPYRALDKVA